MAEEKPIGTVLVAGAGVSGIKAAIELAETGYKVLLTDASPQIGGILAKLDNQFPTDHCGMCRMLPMVGREYASQYCMRKGLYHENIEILPFAELTRVEGDAGNFTVELLQKARFIDTDKCNGLGECIAACPVDGIADEFNHGLTTRKAVYKPVPHSTPQMLLIDRDACTRCGECVKVCPTNVINLDAADEAMTRQVHAIILASGVKLYNLREFEDAKSWAVSPDVVSSLAFERIISGTGTFKGEILRPSDKKPARKIAWVQCMGSRNRRQKRDYCSSICCMFALKEAVLAKEKGGDEMETTIFYMDMRTFGKDFYRYYEKAVEQGVNLVRCRVQQVMLNPDKSLSMRYYDSETEEFTVADYDMVVLSTGQIPYETHKNLADLLNVTVNDQGLLPAATYEKVKLVKPGVFVCGSLMGLTDISEAMSSGIAAAGQASRLLNDLDVQIMEEEAIPEPRAKDREDPLVAVALCRCSEKVKESSVNFETLSAGLKRLNSVGEVHVLDMLCSDAGKEDLLELLLKSKCNRLVIGACHPFMYRNTLKNIAKKAGFTSSLCDIMDLSSIVHKGFFNPEKTDQTQEAYSDIRSTVENLKLKPALHVQNLPIHPAALVVGGGISGMHAALCLAQRGVDVHLVEKSDQLGGYAGQHITHTIDGLTPVSMAKDLTIKLLENKHITLHKQCEVVQTQGSLGAFETKIKDLENQENLYLRHGAAIIATGGQEGTTTEYEYGNSDRILTQATLKTGLETGDIDVSEAETIVMIQCVGSREKPETDRASREYCSRICCIGAISNALTLREKNPDARIFILYRDVMTYGFTEQYYTKARLAGIIFVSYTLESKPRVELSDGNLVITFNEPVLNSEITLTPDYLVLSTGVDPEPSNRQVGAAFNVPVNSDGFFVEADSKWRPVEFQKVGLYVAGVAHSPMTLKDAIVQAEAAAQKTYAYLSGRHIHTAHTISRVHDAICVRCQRCVDICPYGARSYDADLDRIIVDSATCQACGMCGVACQNNAAEIMGFSDKQIMAVIDARMSKTPVKTAAK